MNNLSWLSEHLWLSVLLLIGTLSACNLGPDAQATLIAPVQIPTVTIPSSSVEVTEQTVIGASPSPAYQIALPEGIIDALPVMSGICFEGAWDAAGRVFVLRSADELRNFFDLADNARLCRRAVARYEFDFSTGDILVGLWNRGVGCTAQHEITAYQRDTAAGQIRIEVQFSTDGTCPYELVRGLWLGVPDAQDFEINLAVQTVE